MGLISSNTFRLAPLQVKSGAMERRRTPRFEAIGPGEMLTVGGDPVGAFRLIDESEAGFACLSEADVEIGDLVHVRIGAAERWRPAVVVNAIDCGDLRRVGLSYTAAASGASLTPRAA
jgi:hypothetical protein